MTIHSTDFRIDRVPEGFKWFETEIGGIPLVHWPSGEICEPLFRYFANGRRSRLFTSVSSMVPEAYALREYLAHCENRLVHWLDGDDDQMESFRNAQRHAVDQKVLTKAQVEKKLGYVFKFYRHIHVAMPFLPNHRLMPRFVGEPDQDFMPITCVEVLTRKRGRVLMWARAEKTSKGVKKRPTPSPEHVRRILEHLRYKVKEERAQRTVGWQAEQRRLEGERNWLIARCESDAGLRREEVAELSVSDIAMALAEERLLGIKSVRNSQAAVAQLLLAATDGGVRNEIVQRLERFRSRGHETLFVTMQRKGKVAAVQFSLDLIEDLVRIGIWVVRQAYVSHWSAKVKSYRPQLNVFLSGRDGQGLAAGSVGDIVNDAFRELDIAGSGHRLRAYYLTNMAWLIWNENYALNGYQFDAAVVNMTLDRLAELAGHADPSVTAQHYLDMALIRHFSRTNRQRLNAMSDLLNAIIYAGPTMSEPVATLLEKIVYKLADETQVLFSGVLQDLVDDDFSFTPPSNPTDKYPPHLQPVT